MDEIPDLKLSREEIREAEIEFRKRLNRSMGALQNLRDENGVPVNEPQKVRILI